MGIGWGLFVGHAGDGEAHAHHAVQVALAESPQTVWTRPGGPQPYRGVVIGADIEHQLAPTTEPVTLLYVEPHSPPGRRLQSSLSKGFRILDVEQVHAACSALGEAPDSTAVAACAAVVAGDHDESKVASIDDPLIQQLIESLPRILPDRLTAARLATQVGLSESRFLHRFRDHTGLPLRPYLRWRRLLTAMTQVMAGQSLTNAAAWAGFSDAAHFTRTFRRHFGIAPRALIGLQASLGA
jgi:AraC-like DNA-binding protein